MTSGIREEKKCTLRSVAYYLYIIFWQNENGNVEEEISNIN